MLDDSPHIWERSLKWTEIDIPLRNIIEKMINHLSSTALVTSKTGYKIRKKQTYQKENYSERKPEESE